MTEIVNFRKSIIERRLSLSAIGIIQTEATIANKPEIDSTEAIELAGSLTYYNYLNHLAGIEQMGPDFSATQNWFELRKKMRDILIDSGQGLHDGLRAFVLDEARDYYTDAIGAKDALGKENTSFFHSKAKSLFKLAQKVPSEGAAYKPKVKPWENPKYISIYNEDRGGDN